MQPLLDRLNKSRARLLAIVESLTEDDLDRPAAGDWTIRQVLSHLVASEEDHRQVIEVIVQGETERLPREFALDAHNARRLEKLGRLERDALLAALAEQRAQTVELLESLDEAALARRGPHPALGEMSAADIFRIIAMHEGRHLRDIEAALGA
ncbi:MAG: hypothetical protein Kow00106_12930 [Anaerolineae bacterium]